MLSSITSLIFGASDDYTGVAELHASPLKTTPTEDEWLLVDRCSSVPGASNPLEDLLIEHPSMSVYGGSTTTSARGRPRNNTQPSEQSSQQVATTSSRPAVRACLSSRSEPYYLRKTTMQKSKASKKLSSKKAFQRQNHTSHAMPRNQNRHTAMRPVVFQPRR